MNAEARRQQQLEAKEIAQTVKKLRFEMRKELRAGSHTALRLLLNPPDWLQSLSVFDFVIAIPRIGRTRTLGYLNKIESGELRTLGQLTQRQRDVLYQALLEHCVFRNGAQ